MIQAKVGSWTEKFWNGSCHACGAGGGEKESEQHIPITHCQVSTPWGSPSEMGTGGLLFHNYILIVTDSNELAHNDIATIFVTFCKIYLQFMKNIFTIYVRVPRPHNIIGLHCHSNSMQTIPSKIHRDLFRSITRASNLITLITYSLPMT